MKRYALFPEKGTIGDLPDEIIEDIKLCMKHYLDPETELDKDGWCFKYTCKVMKDKESGNILFLKLVGFKENPKVAVLNIPEETIKDWGFI